VTVTNGHTFKFVTVVTDLCIFFSFVGEKKRSVTNTENSLALRICACVFNIFSDNRGNLGAGIVLRFAFGFWIGTTLIRLR